MATGAEVLEMLIPTGGWVIYGDDFNSIRYDEDVIPVSEKDFNDGFAKYDSYKLQKDQSAITAKINAQSKLEALGLTLDDLAALGL
jgi:hypothetical protein